MSLVLAAMLVSPQVLPFIDRAELRTLARVEAMQSFRPGHAGTPPARVTRGGQVRRPVRLAAAGSDGR